mmetsp:Transcript_8082/g.23113  ORF Transcript_8082/g.23113 Transcript_8082/m.23113 type:complete len:247 (-) Transcript_8082:64-804(-)
MIATNASGQLSATPAAREATMPALILKRSSLVIPGFLGTPAGITTRSQPCRQNNTQERQRRFQRDRDGSLALVPRRASQPAAAAAAAAGVFLRLTLRHSASSAFPSKDLTVVYVLMCDKSAITPFVPFTSYKWSSLTRLVFFSKRERGCPIPPDAPRTATLNPAFAPNPVKCAASLAIRLSDILLQQLSLSLSLSHSAKGSQTSLSDKNPFCVAECDANKSRDHPTLPKTRRSSTEVASVTIPSLR